MVDAIYRFSRCEVDPNARELRVDGQMRAIEPPSPVVNTVFIGFPCLNFLSYLFIHRLGSHKT
jgi:hypothetical protein